MNESKAPSRASVTIIIVVLCLVWGSTWYVIKRGLKDLPPFTSAGFRFALAWVCIAALAPILSRKEGGRPPTRWLSLAMGLCNFAGSYAIVYWSESHLPSSLVAVLWSTFPMMMAACSHWFLQGELIRGRQWFGFVAGFCGVAFLMRTDVSDLHGGSSRTLLAGCVLLLSPFVSAIGTTLVKKHGRDVSSTLLNRNGMLIGAIVLLSIGWGTERDAPLQWTVPAILSVVYLALFGTVLTFGLYFWVMRFAPAYQLSLIAYVTPMIALFIGAVVGDEPVRLHTLIGAALILSGVALVMLGKKRTR